MFPFDACPVLAEILDAQRAYTDAVQRKNGCIVQHVFHRNGKRIKDFYGAWRKACKAAGVPGRIPHDFRRTAVRNLVRAGVSEAVAMKLTGHKTRAVFDRYNITSGDDLRDAARRLGLAYGQSDGQSGAVSAINGRKSVS